MTPYTLTDKQLQWAARLLCVALNYTPDKLDVLMMNAARRLLAELERQGRWIAGQSERDALESGRNVLQGWYHPDECGCNTATCRGTCMPAKTAAALPMFEVVRFAPICPEAE